MSVKRALVCAPLAPEFDRESGSRRIYHLIEFLKEAGWAVTFVAQNEADAGRHMRMLRQQGVAAYGEGDRQIDELLAVGRFDLAIVAFWHLAAGYLPRIRALSPSTRVIVDSIDVHFLRQARHVFRGRRSDDAGQPLDDAFGRSMLGEINTYAAADGVLTVSQKEADLLNDFLTDLTRPLAHAVPLCEALAQPPTTFGDRRGILFLGNFRHPPNIDALEYLTDQIAPRLDRSVIAEHPIIVVGNGVTEAVTRACSHGTNIRLVGWVPSVVPYFERVRVSVAPLRYGAGTKGKVIQALTFGTPSVATSIGAEGLNLESRRDILIADDPDAFADAIGELLRDGALWRKLSRNGQAVIGKSHDRRIVKERFLEVLDHVLAHKPNGTAGTQVPHGLDPRLREYRALVNRVRENVSATVPADTKLLVISKGDEDLVRFTDRVAWHFPRNGANGYAGHYPADSAAAIRHLELLRAEGARFLVLPQTAFWWLNHYAELRKYLEAAGQPVCSNDDCLIYQLPEPFLT